ncbi:MAG: iron-containing alcohol dehydrogenase [Odoribacteraceae bacterium]|jgi:NADP-dependent alcohol dehydrogenase|nr:iron-containing alcohol dehydrogenase [Odoribacteraceae bacterium]
MDNFEYHNPVRVVFGKGKIAGLDRLLPKYCRLMMTYGGGSIKHNGVYEQVKKALKDREVTEFGGIEPNPRYETLMEAVGRARLENIDFLLAVGGGSVIDGTKFIAAAACFPEGDPWDILSKGTPVKAALPIGTVLTLPATGSEMNGNSVITRGITWREKEKQEKEKKTWIEQRLSKLESPTLISALEEKGVAADKRARNRCNVEAEKLSFSSRHVLPRFSVIDPETTYSLPRHQVANGVIDSFVHVMEQYYTTGAADALQDRLAEGILKTLIELGPRLVHEEPEYASRSTFSWTATMALNGLIGCGVPQDWSSHHIGHELTALHELDHGVTLAIVLPGVMRETSGSRREKLLQYAERVWGIDPSRPDAGELAIAETEAFFRGLGVKTRLSEYGIGMETIEQIATRLQKRGEFELGGIPDVNTGNVRTILVSRL